MTPRLWVSDCWRHLVVVVFVGFSSLSSSEDFRRCRYRQRLVVAVGGVVAVFYGKLSLY